LRERREPLVTQICADAEAALRAIHPDFVPAAVAGEDNAEWANQLRSACLLKYQETMKKNGTRDKPPSGHNLAEHNGDFEFDRLESSTRTVILRRTTVTIPAASSQALIHL